MISKPKMVKLSEVAKGDKVQIRDLERTYPKTIGGVVEGINVFASGCISVLLSGRKDYYGPSDKLVLVQKKSI